MKILLIHQYAGNKGDRAVAFAMCSIIKEQHPNSEITISTSSPNLWKEDSFYTKNNIQFIPNSWDFENVGKKNSYWAVLQKIKKYTFTIMRELFLVGNYPAISRMFINPCFSKAVQTSDIVISVGGHHFTTILSRDLVSSINYDAMSVLSQKKRLICFSQSFGPFVFHNNRNKRLTYKILSNCSLLLAREKNSITELENFGISQSYIQITKESVISLNRLFTLYQRPSLREKQIGIAIYATQKRTEKNHQAYIHTIGDSCKYFVSKGYKVIFFPMELKDTAPDDRILIQEILQYINLPQQCSYIDVDMPTDIHLQAVSKCQCFIGHKTHSTIFALASGTPLIGIAYHPKTEEFMEQFGINQFCINDQELSTEVVIEKFNLLENDLDNIGKHLFEQARVFTDKVVSDLCSIIQ